MRKGEEQSDKATPLHRRSASFRVRKLGKRVLRKSSDQHTTQALSRSGGEASSLDGRLGGSDSGLPPRRSSGQLREALSSPGIVALGGPMPSDLPDSKRSSRTSLAGGVATSGGESSEESRGKATSGSETLVGGHRKTSSNGSAKDPVSSASSARILNAASHIKNFLSPNYKTRSEEFRKLFAKIPDSEKFVIDYGCAFQREILVHGRLYLSQHSLCFYANIFKWETSFVLNFKDIAHISKERTAKVIPNAIQVVTTSGDKYFFTSFATRDKSYMALFKLWQSALLDQVMSPGELWEWAQCGYDKNELPHSGDDEDGLTDVSSCQSGLMKAATFSVGSAAAEFPKSPKGRSPPPPPNGDDASEASEQDGEVVCPCTSHEGVELLNRVYPLSVDQMFILLFTDSPFFRDFQDYRNAVDNRLQEWKTDKKTGKNVREVRFTLSLNHSMGPKSTEVFEKQMYSQGGVSGGAYMVRCEATNSGIPYADSFAVLTTYCLTRVSENSSRIRAHGSPLFKKNIWGIVKSFIEKNTVVGINEHFTDLDACLRRECARLGLPSGAKEEGETPAERPKGPKKGERANHLTGSAPILDHGISPRSASPAGEWGSMEGLAKLGLGLLLLLLFLNAVLYWRLLSAPPSAPSAVDQLGLGHVRAILERSSLGAAEAESLYREYQAESGRRWESALSSALSSLSHMETELSRLKAELETARAAFKASAQPLSFHPKPEL